jgi:SAM-dependent methyltransferase
VARVDLALTGERTLPGVPSENYWFRRHEAAYRFAARRCRGLDVVDVGAGEGYGTALLAATARSALGVELVAEVCAHAGAAYPHVPVVRTDCCALPLADGSVDAVVSLQVIEHLWDIPRALTETARVLRPDGLFVCATPNRLTFTPGGSVPVNPFHTVEFSAGELARLLAGWFETVALHGVFHGQRLAAAELARGAALPAMQLERPPEAWPAWLSELVASVIVDDFTVDTARPPTASLDLIALARGPRRRPRT